MDELDEARKWLKLGYETFGPGGALAVANAMGMSIGETEPTPQSRRFRWTTIKSSDKASPDPSELQPPIHRGPPGSAPHRMSKPSTECPKRPPRGISGWRSYKDTGNPDWFHCGFEGYLEDRVPTPERPVAECFYDERERLVDETHPYSGCKGPADSYPASDWQDHVFKDPGASGSRVGPRIWNHGGMPPTKSFESTGSLAIHPTASVRFARHCLADPEQRRAAQRPGPCVSTLGTSRPCEADGAP
jgi:hypothetical protein